MLQRDVGLMPDMSCQPAANDVLALGCWSMIVRNYIDIIALLRTVAGKGGTEWAAWEGLAGCKWASPWTQALSTHVWHRSVPQTQETMAIAH